MIRKYTTTLKETVVYNGMEYTIKGGDYNSETRKADFLIEPPNSKINEFIALSLAKTNGETLNFNDIQKEIDKS